MAKLNKQQVLEAVILYQDGLSLRKISEYFGITRQSIWDLLKRRTKLRPQIRSGKDNHFYRGGISAENKAQNICEYAVARGIIKRPTTCEKCGQTKVYKNKRTGIEAHHPNYKQPLRVMWLCKKCHYEIHK